MKIERPDLARVLSLTALATSWLFILAIMIK
jgi:hypothetical protein